LTEYVGVLEIDNHAGVLVDAVVSELNKRLGLVGEHDMTCRFQNSATNAPLLTRESVAFHWVLPWRSSI